MGSVPERPVAVAAACGACRKQKIKCPGERPSCQRCVRRGIDCHYTTNPGETKPQALRRNYLQLRSQVSAHRELLELMRRLPERDAQEVLRRIRAGAGAGAEDLGGMLQHVKAGSVLVQMAVRPETRMQYVLPYRSEIPAGDVADNPYLESLLYEAAGLLPGTGTGTGTGTGRIASGAMAEVEHQSPYLKPLHAAEMVDPRLSDARPSLWTTVCADDALMRDLLGVFLRCEYHFAAAFQKDYFLEDLAGHRPGPGPGPGPGPSRAAGSPGSAGSAFCSPLLVNVVLAYACVCHPGLPRRAEYWNPNTLLYRFLAEARRIWELECGAARVTTVQAGILLNAIYTLCGLDEVGQAYRVQAVALAGRMGLFERAGGGGGEGVDEGSTREDRVLRGRAFTAWALYNWET
ncbi:hypothetical protein E4U41_005187, partial [Claviceps citrina]